MEVEPVEEGEPGAVEETAEGDNPEVDAEPAPPGMERFITSTGKVIFVSVKQVIPTAKSRRKVIRRVTLLIVVVALIAIVAVTIALLDHVSNVGPDKPVDQDKAIREAVGYDAEKNPFFNESANMLGITLGAKTAVILDGSSGSRPWLGIAGDAALIGLTKSKPTQSAVVIISGDGGVFAYPSSPMTWTPGFRAQATPFFESHPASGGSNLAEAVQHAVAMNVTDIVLITGQNIDESDSSKIARALGESTVRLSAMFIDSDSRPVKALTAKTKGQYVGEIASKRITDWFVEFDGSPEKDRQRKLADEDSNKAPVASSLPLAFAPTSAPAEKPVASATQPDKK